MASTTVVQPGTNIFHNVRVAHPAARLQNTALVLFPPSRGGEGHMLVSYAWLRHKSRL